MNIGTLWRKARYAAAELLFRLGGFVEPKEPIDFEALVGAAMESMIKPTPTAAEALRYQGIDPAHEPTPGKARSFREYQLMLDRAIVEQTMHREARRN